MENYEQALDMQILNQNPIFMSGQKANGEYEIYSAKISSLNSIENKNFYINKSNNLQIIEDSFSYYQENQFYYFLFDFYLIEKGEHFLEVSVEENYLNFVTLKSDKLDFSSVNFVNSIDLEIKRANNLEVLK